MHQFVQAGAEGAQRQVTQAQRVQLRLDLGPAPGHGQGQLTQRLFGVQAPGGMAIGAVDEYPVTGLHQQQYRQDVPGVLVFLAGITGPVQVHRQGRRRGHLGAAGLHETRQFGARFLLYPQQHQERAHLHRLGLAAQDHGERLLRLGPAEGAAAALALAENTDEGGEGVLHRRLLEVLGVHVDSLQAVIGFGQAGELAAQLGGRAGKQ